jgi:hypothetical protein
MKKFIWIHFILFYSFSLVSQIESDLTSAQLKRKKVVFEWNNFKQIDTTIFGHSTRLSANIKSYIPLKKAELIVDGNKIAEFKILNAGTHFKVRIDQSLDFDNGSHSFYLFVVSENDTIPSPKKTFTAKDSAGPPNIRWVKPNSAQVKVDSVSFSVHANVLSDLPVKDVKLFINGIQDRGFVLLETIGNTNNKSIAKNIQLLSDTNIVYISAVNEAGLTISDSLKIIYDCGWCKQKRVALVIGNSEYKNTAMLENPVNDAIDMTKALKRLNFKVQRLLDANYKQLLEAVQNFGDSAMDADVAFFYYAGHGVQVDGNNYLIPVDADIKGKPQVKTACVDANIVLSGLETAKSKVNLIVMDACRDNPFERSWTRSTKGNGLTSLDSPVGTLIAYATAPGRTAADGSDRNGLYTSALLKYIENPNLSIIEIFMNTRIQVLKDSNEAQVPWEGSCLTRNIYLLK